MDAEKNAFTCKSKKYRIKYFDELNKLYTNDNKANLKDKVESLKKDIAEHGLTVKTPYK